MLLEGSCLCGGVAFQIRTFGNNIAHCHCTMCQKFHGAAFSTFLPVNIEHITWRQGNALLRTYTAHNGSKRQFCQNCGSSLTFQSANTSDSQSLEIALATLNVPTAPTAANRKLPQPDAHVHTKSQVSWYTINDTLPQYPGDRES
ncbi:GFA family protein [Thalassotalea litorea]|uniref:GFA family protein n=1 Tax=Thalassotalea litorea TaxID=2020715 RepID=UPI0037358B62